MTGSQCDLEPEGAARTQVNGESPLLPPPSTKCPSTIIYIKNEKQEKRITHKERGVPPGMLFVLGFTLPWLTPDVPPTVSDTWSRAPPLQEGWAVHHHSLGLEVSSPELGPPSPQGSGLAPQQGAPEEAGSWAPSLQLLSILLWAGFPLARPCPQLLWKTCLLFSCTA